MSRFANIDLVAFNERVRARLEPIFSRRWVRWLSYLGFAFLMALAIVWLIFSHGLMTRQQILDYRLPMPTSVRGYHGEPVGTYARERRVELAFEEFPEPLVQAFISAEDKTFFSHGGIDYPGLVGAVAEYGFKTVTGGGRSKGGSTITQQVSKYLLEDNSYSVTRKIREAILAFRLESTLEKEQILELYLNSIFLGRNAYGVHAASQAYFDKNLDELTLPEIAYLAAIPKGPANYDPVRAKDKATARRNYVLREMAKNDFITAAQRDAAVAEPLVAIRYGANAKFVEQGGYFLEDVRRFLVEEYGETGEDSPNSVYAGGLWVRTSMDPVMQNAAAEALREGLAVFDGTKGWRDLGMTIDMQQDWASQLRLARVGTGFPDWRKAVVLEKDARAARIGFANGSTGMLPRSAAVMPVRGRGGPAFDALKPGMVIVVRQLGVDDYAIRSIPEIGGGFLAQEVQTGRVLAMQGGFDVLGSSYNRATQAKRQPGSAFKPVVYVTALENGMTPSSILVDEPFCVYQGAGLGEKCFKNFDGEYAGPKTLRWGVEQSRNLMTIRAANETGLSKITDTARRLGVGDYPDYLSIALGAGDTTVAALVNAYAVLANHGRKVEQSLIDFIQDRRGKVIYRTDNRCAVMTATNGGACNAPDWDGKAMPRPPSRNEQVLDPQAAYQMVHIMEGVVERGTAVRLRDLDRPLFGKTGTTNGPTNTWFVGGTPRIVAGTYVGYDQPRNMGSWAQGGRIAAPIFKQWAETALKDEPKIPFVAPAGIRMVRVDRVTGKRVFGTFPTEVSPKSEVIWEAFKPETEPRRSVRRAAEAEPEEELPTAPKAQPKKQEQSLDTGDFLQRQGGIY